MTFNPSVNLLFSLHSGFNPTFQVSTLDYQISVAYQITVALDRKIVQHSLGKKSDLGISIAQQLFQSIYLKIMYCKKK